MSDPVDSLAPAPPASAAPAEIGGYQILEELAPAQCFLALAPGNRRVTLKMLEPDLIVRDQLHPSVRDRLARVREIAHAGVANLHGAEREGAQAYLVWEYVDGVPLETWCETTRLSPRELLLLARELVLAVEGLNARGIVHGAIHGRNVIVDPLGRLKLIHISPYLYTDPAADAAAVVELLREVARRTGLESSALNDALPDESSGEDQTTEPLRSIGSRITSLIELRQAPAPPDAEIRADHSRRQRTLLGAAALLVFGLMLAYGLWRYTSGATTASVLPPEAPATAMRQ